MDWDAILAWVDKSPTLAGIIATVVGTILALLITTGVLALVKGRKLSFEWISPLARRVWGFRPTTMARLNDAVRVATIERIADHRVASMALPEGRPVLEETVSTPSSEQFAPGHGLDDLEAHVRASDQCHVVKYRNGLEIGIVTPTRGRFMARHMRKGEAGPFDSMQDAMQALWEMD